LKKADLSVLGVPERWRLLIKKKMLKRFVGTTDLFGYCADWGNGNRRTRQVSPRRRKEREGFESITKTDFDHENTMAMRNASPVKFVAFEDAACGRFYVSRLRSSANPLGVSGRRAQGYDEMAVRSGDRIVQLPSLSPSSRHF
jgi:hypothetical protein